MASTLMQQLVKWEGFCCIYKYIKETETINAGDLAKHLGVDVTTIKRWRQRVQDGSVDCGYGATGNNGCEFK